MSSATGSSGIAILLGARLFGLNSNESTVYKLYNGGRIQLQMLNNGVDGNT
jgi:hypothetical protein